MQAKKDTESKETVEITKEETLDTGGETFGSTATIKGSFSLKDTTDTVAAYKKDNIFKYCQVQPLITSEHEKEMYSLLNEAVGDTYYIFPQVHFSEILGTNIRKERNRLALYVVDFAIVKKDTFQVLAIIEVDGMSHEGPQKYIDRERNVIFNHFEIPTIRCKTYTTGTSANGASLASIKDRYSANKLRQIIEGVIEGRCPQCSERLYYTEWSDPNGHGEGFALKCRNNTKYFDKGLNAMWPRETNKKCRYYQLI